jgi:hypothetical protein
MKKVVLTLLFVVSISVIGCPKKVKMDDPRIQPMLEAAKSFDRAAYGFSPIPASADVRLESRPRANYDAMLHIYSKTSRTIAFRKTDKGYRWIGEQEIFKGPKKYKTVDGILDEQIILTYEIERVSHYRLNRLNISYWGEDKQLVILSGRRDGLTLEDVKPVLKEWGY